MSQNKQTKFKEQLPDQCPPATASDQAILGVYRLVDSKQPKDACFTSKAAQGKKCPPNVAPCRWASCSLVTDPAAYGKLKSMKSYRWAAKINIPKGAGLSETKEMHIDFWGYSNFDIKKSVEAVMEIDA